jgi:hypothetical protein
MKTIVILALAALSKSCFAADCDCTITPFKPPECFQKCVTKIISHASYSELTGKYGIPRDIADKIISAREHNSALDASVISTIDSIFRTKQDSAERNPKM